MNLNRLFLIGCACLFLCLPLFSQTHDRDGYYINLKGDTVFGKFVNYQEPTFSPSAISFQARGSAEPIKLTPDQCKRIALDQSDHYIAYTGKRLTNSVDYRSEQSTPDDVFQDISAFLLELYSNGHYHLFQYLDNKRPNFFISEGEGPVQELSYKEFTDNGRLVQWPGFHLQLADFFRPLLDKDPSRQTAIDNVAYNGAALTALFNKMAGGENSMAHKGKYPAQIWIGAGLSSNSLKVTKGSGFDAASIYYEVAPYASQLVPLFEGGVRFFSQRNYGRFFVRLDLSYYNFKFSHDFYDAPSNTHTTTTYKSNVLAIPAGVGYKLIKKDNFSLDLSGGIAMLAYLKNTETQVNTGPAPATNTSDGSSQNFSFFGEAAVEFVDRFSIFGAYYSPASITQAGEYNSVITAIKFGARIRVF